MDFCSVEYRQRRTRSGEDGHRTCPRENREAEIYRRRLHSSVSANACLFDYMIALMRNRREDKGVPCADFPGRIL